VGRLVGGTVVGARVLVVDDEADLRFILRRCFDRAGYDVLEAGDGAAALRSVQEVRPDLVVTDLVMPVMDGFELIRRLRADPVTADIPIIVVSSNWTMASGADAAVGKPFEVRDVLELAKDLIKNGSDAQ
jgi:two-component system, chemotaxis family, chemotaxis protein CheY